MENGLRPEGFRVVERGIGRYRYDWASYGYSVLLEQVRETRYGMTAEILVETVAMLPETGRRGHLYFGQINVSKAPEKALLEALKHHDDRVPWMDLLEVVRVQTARDMRQGEPTLVLRDVPVRPRRELVERMMPLDETSVFFGDGASGKSWIFGVGLALAVASGQPIGPLRPLARCPVLVLDWETTAEEWSERLERLSMGTGIPVPPDVHYRAQWRPLADDLERVRSDVAATGAGLVIVDSITLAVGGEVTADACVPFYNALRSLTGTTRSVLSHVSKATSQLETGVGDPYGSIFVKNFARSAWAVRKDEIESEDGFEVILTHRKVNGGRLQGSIGLRLRFEDPDGAVTIAGVDPMARPGLAIHASIPDQMLAALARGEKKDTAELASELGKDEKVISVTGRRLEARGLLVRFDERKHGRGNRAVYGRRTDHDDPETKETRPPRAVAARPDFDLAEEKEIWKHP
jgi:AAA domain-containing protein